MPIFSLVVTLTARIRNEQIRGSVTVEQFVDNVGELRWRRFGRVLRRDRG